MAQPIPLYYPKVDAARGLGARLQAAPEEHALAILSAYELLEELHQKGILDLLRGGVGAGGDIVTRIAEAANTPEAITLTRNTISLLRIVSAMDPEILHRVAELIAKKPATGSGTGLWGTLRRLTSKESLRVVSAAAYGLKVFGTVLIAQKK